MFLNLKKDSQKMDPAAANYIKTAKQRVKRFKKCLGHQKSFEKLNSI